MAVRDGKPVALGSARQRTVLGLLAANHGTPVSRDSICDLLWGGDPPPTAVPMIQTYVSRLRRALDPHAATRPDVSSTGTGLLATTPTGYQLQSGRARLDAADFRRLTDQARSARRAEDLTTACDLFDRALGLWRGDPFADLDMLRTLPAVTALSRQRAAAVLDLAEVAVGAGYPHRAVPHLADLAEREPLNERVCAWLMLALAGSGEQAAALAAFEAMRRRLADLLGVDPGEELATAHDRVLRHLIPAGRLAAGRDPLVPGSPGGASNYAGPGSPGNPADPGSPGNQLPPALADFTGRRKELAELMRALTGADEAAAPPVAVVTGLPGVGKSSLAVQAAHALRTAFPDGQLWIPLNGASGRPRDPAEVLGEMLRLLGVLGPALPDSVSGRAALYRSRLAGKRVLIIADDAAAASQVEPLLPGTARSAVIITSRSALAMPPGAKLLPLAPFTSREATALLARIAGSPRVAAQREAAAELAAACGMLPLAVRIAGARLAARPAWPLSVLASKLSSHLRRLDELQAGEVSVRASVASAYEGLSQRAREAWCLLGMLGPLDVAEWVIAALLGVPDAACTVSELTDHSLLTAAGLDATGQPRYRLHDLLRDFAAERLAGGASPHFRAALDRVLTGWRQLAFLAAERLPDEPYFPPAGRPPPAGPVPRDPAASLTEDPVAWFTAERTNLIAAVESACRTGDHRLAADLGRALAGFHYLHSRHDDAERIWAAVAAAAEEASDPLASAQARLRLAAVACGRGRHVEAAPAITGCESELVRLGDMAWVAAARYWQAVCAGNKAAYADCLRFATRAVVAARQASDHHGEFMALRMRGLAAACIGAPVGDGVRWCEQALTMARKAGSPLCEHEILHSLAFAYTLTGRYEAALALCRQGLAVNQRLDYQAGIGAWLGVLGDTYQCLGRHEEAAHTYVVALSLFESHLMRRHLGICLLKLGYTHLAMADYPAARSFLTQSLPVFRELKLSHYEDRARQVITICENPRAAHGEARTAWLPRSIHPWPADLRARA